MIQRTSTPNRSLMTKDIFKTAIKMT